MSALSTVIRLSNFLGIFLVVAGWLMVLGMVLLCCTAGDRRACLRRWRPGIFLVAGIATFFSVAEWQGRVRAVETRKKVAARREARLIETAAQIYFSLSDPKEWPAGENREVVGTLTKPREGGREPFLKRRNLEVAADGSAVDPWGRPYLMEVRGEKGLIVWSAGPDGVRGTEDDLPEREIVTGR